MTSELPNNDSLMTQNIGYVLANFKEAVKWLI